MSGSMHLVLLLGFAALLAGCTSDSQNDVGSNTANEPESPAVELVSGPPVVGPPVWTLSVDPTTSAPIGSVTSFSIDDAAISVAFPIVQVPSGARIDAVWIFEGTALNLPATSVVIDQDRRDGWIAFSLATSGSSRWPDGSYRVSLMSSGVEVAAADVHILENESEG
ncbi:hypothetical protein BH23CHL5_BH23CHL5_14080 [soil metagenome]